MSYKDSSSSSTASGGIGFTGLLQVAFIVLKLCKVIDWSWWWVTAPLWIPLALVIVVFIIAGIITLFQKD